MHAIIYPSPKPDKAPSGYSQWISPIVIPSPPISASHWASAVQKAQKFVSLMTVAEKVGTVTILTVVV